MAETYARWRLPQLWTMIADDDPGARQHLATLRRQQTALETQRDHLRSLRDQLAQGWPPERSEAAKAFIQRINDMIDAMTETANAAAVVRVHTTHVVDAISDARTKLAPLLAGYDAAPEYGDQRVGRTTKRSMDDFARRTFMATDQVVAEAAAKLAVDMPDYARIRMRAVEPVPQLPGGAGGTQGGGGGSGTSGSRITFPPPSFSPPAPAVDASEIVLAGSQAGVTPGWPNGPDSRVSDPVASRGVLDGRAPHAVTATGQPRTTSAVAAGRAATIAPVGGAAGRTAVAGPVYGQARPAAAPIGGGASGHPVGSLGAYRGQSVEGQTGGRRASGEDRGEVWTVKKGVKPVLEAPPAPVHDPGPGVLGIDR